MELIRSNQSEGKTQLMKLSLPSLSSFSLPSLSSLFMCFMKGCNYPPPTHRHHPPPLSLYEALRLYVLTVRTTESESSESSPCFSLMLIIHTACLSKLTVGGAGGRPEGGGTHHGTPQSVAEEPGNVLVGAADLVITEYFTWR